MWLMTFGPTHRAEEFSKIQSNKLNDGFINWFEKGSWTNVIYQHQKQILIQS